MEAILDKIDLNNLDKSKWESYPFEKIAAKISETVDPNKTELEIYIGLEHIDAEDIHIRRFGVPADVSGGKLKCYPGDVIFGKRRAYQRKAAIVDFEGICSAHAFVLRANPEVINPKLFPFFLHSDQFMHRMVDISVGGLSPTINWGDLKHQEFLLPPKEEQAKLAELLWAMDEMIERERNLLIKSIVVQKSKEKKLFNEDELIVEKILDVAEVRRGKFTPRPRNNPKYFGGDIPFIQTGEVVDSGKWILKYSQTLNELGLSVSKMFERNTIVMTIAANIGYVGMLDFDSAFTDSLVGINAKEEKLSQEYLYYYLNYNQKQIESLSTESAQKNLSIDGFKSFVVKYPELKIRQNEIVDQLDYIRINLLNVQTKIKSSQSLQKSLINQVF